MPTTTLEERPAHTISASEMARRSAAARRAKSANRKAPVKSVYQADEYHTFIRNLGTRCQFMLDRCCLLFDKAKSGTEADKVASAVVKLFDVWADITQTPRRGVLRPEKMKGLIRSYGMKSAMEKMLAQPSIVMSDEAVKKAAIEPATEPPTETPIDPPQPPIEMAPQPIAEPDSTPPIDDEDQPEPTADDFTKQNEDSLISPAQTVPAPDTPGAA